MNNKIISVAPMMDWTDRHCRYFHRLIAPSVTLYTEMVTTGALIFGDNPRFLRNDESEHPVVLQLGGSAPADLAICAKMGEEAGYDAINLNCGCPSDRVQSGSFGACLMKEPQTVAEGIKAMCDAVSIPVTVKCRIGIDDSPDYTFLEDFVGTVAAAGCKTFIIHARKAWLKGLSPKENRDIPPLQYDIPAKIKAAFPTLNIQVNGGITTIEQIHTMLGLDDAPRACAHEAFQFDGVMIGREAYQNPWFLREIEKVFYKTDELLTEEQIIEQMMVYIEKQQKVFDTPIKSVTRHMTGLFQGRVGARKWRQILSTEVHEDGVTPDILKRAYSVIAKEQ